MKKRISALGGILFGILILIVGSCSSGNSTGPATPLPTGQTGSIVLFTSTDAGCYVESGTSTCVNPPLGTNPVRSLATEVATSAKYLFVGDSGGNLNAWTTNGTSRPSSAAISCGTTGLTSSISGIATYFNSTSSTSYVYFASSNSGTLTLGTNSSSSTACGTTSTNITLSIGSSSVVGLATSVNGSTPFVYGITSTGSYFSFQAGTTPPSLSLQALPSGLPSTVNITAITADKYGYLYVTDTANPSGNPGSIYVFYSNNGTLQLVATFNTGNFNDLNNPTAITTYVGNNPTQQYCTTGQCEFVEVANGNGNIMQLVFPAPGYAGASPSIPLNEFNAPYANCEVYNTGAMTSFPDATLTGIAGNTVPYVYVGQNGTKSGPCLSVPSGSTFGNSVTAYNGVGE